MAGRLRAAVVGVRGMGIGHIKAILALPEMYELAAICDINPETARKVSEEYKVPGYLSLADMLKHEKPDVVSLATPHPFHCAGAVACARAGVHVLVEKPIASTVSEADRMIQAHKRAGTVLSVVFQQRYQPLQRTIRKLVIGDAIGEITRIHMTATCFRSDFYYKLVGWRGTWEGEGGGVLLNQAPHALDQYLWQSGLEVKTVIGRCEAFMHPIETEDRASAIVTFANGAMGTLVASTTDAPGIYRIEMVGDKGAIVFENGKASIAVNDVPTREFNAKCREEWGSPKAEWKDVVPEDPGYPYRSHDACFYHLGLQIRGEKSEYVPGEEGRKSLELANAIILSGWKGGSVKCPVSRREYGEFLAGRIRAAKRGKKRTGERSG
ncbi:MAG: Gfo/Idh/MocA family oxidoreductase [Planctomycetota bacterium]|nr:Gfo/Idh/MocA family oxidoreductase [Planctomycetota bacterium]